MNSFDLFRQERINLPRTPAAALRALELGIAPPEAYVYLSTSVRPLEEEPVDQAEISRILARKELEFPLVKVLMRVMKKLSRSMDAETALFGSEGITTLETRYSRRIRDCEGALARRFLPRRAQELARLHAELAELHSDNDVLRRFHLRESFFASRSLLGRRKEGAGVLKARAGEVALAAATLCGLGLAAQAFDLVRGYGTVLGAESLYMEAAVRYEMRDFKGCYRCLREYSLRAADIQPERRRAMRYWLGEEEL